MQENKPVIVTRNDYPEGMTPTSVKNDEIMTYRTNQKKKRVAKVQPVEEKKLETQIEPVFPHVFPETPENDSNSIFANVPNSKPATIISEKPATIEVGLVMDEKNVKKPEKHRLGQREVPDLVFLCVFYYNFFSHTSHVSFFFHVQNFKATTCISD